MLDDRVNKTVTVDDAITVSWTAITNREMPIVGHTVEWTVPGTRQYALAPNVIHDGNITYLRVSFNDV